MSNYTPDPAQCRVDFFKPSGKWYTTEALNFGGLWEKHPADALQVACSAQLHGQLNGMIAICLAPYTMNSFPVAIVVGGGDHLQRALHTEG